MMFHRVSVLAVASALALIAGITFVSPAQAEESMQGLAEQKAHIVKIMKDLKLEAFVGKDKPLCKAFYDDFRKQTNIEYIQPLFTTDDYDDPRLKAYRDKCPKLQLNKHAAFARVDPAEVIKTLREEGVSEDKLDEEMDKYASYILFGTANFRLYQVDLDNNPKNGEEFIFYDQDHRMVKPEKYLGQISEPGAGTYKMIDFVSCKELGGVHAGGVFDGKARSARYNGIVKYKGRYYIFAFESTQPPYGSLHLDGIVKSPSGEQKLGPQCSYSPPGLWNRKPQGEKP